MNRELGPGEVVAIEQHPKALEVASEDRRCAAGVLENGLARGLDVARSIGDELPMKLGRAVTVASMDLTDGYEARSSAALTRGNGLVLESCRRGASVVIDVLASAGVHGSVDEIVYLDNGGAR